MFLTQLFKKLASDTRGNFSIMLSVVMMTVLLAAGAAIDVSRISSLNNEAQNTSDAAVLAAARYMATSADSGDSEKERQEMATKVAKKIMGTVVGKDADNQGRIDVKFTDGNVEVSANLRAKPYMMDLFGKPTLRHKVKSGASIASREAKDIDIVLISDATGSMANTLDAIQANMKDFSWDLSNALSDRDVQMGSVRVKYIFYRDYSVDNHKDWTGPSMTPAAGLEEFGPMYISKFYKLPSERTQMDTYVDFFAAQGGGSFQESGLEAISHSLDQSDWGNGKETVRVIVLWTDASNRALHDKTEEYALTVYDPTTLAYFSYDYWVDKMGTFFADMSQEQRQDYFYDNIYPKSVPKTLASLNAKFQNFHRENANGFPDVKTMTVNIVSDCWGHNPCGDWPTLDTWEGVQVIQENNTLESKATYDKIVEQVTEMVINQAAVKNLALKY